MSPRILKVPADTSGPQLMQALNLSAGRALIVLMGGAANLSEEDAANLEAQITKGIARAATALGTIVIDGGTDAGVMGMLDAGLGAAGHPGPYVGVTPASKVRPSATTHEGWPLGPHHTHFVLVEGDEFGDETPAMYALVEALGRQGPSLGILANGGGTARRELAANVAQGREVIILSGSGRLADELTSAIRRPESNQDAELGRLVEAGRFTLFDISEPPDRLSELIQQKLHASRGGNVLMAKKPSSSDRRRKELNELVDQLDLENFQKEILKKRWVDQTVWFGGKARHAKRWMTRLRAMIIIGGLLLPVLATLPDSAPTWFAEWGAPIVSLIVAATAGLEGFFKYADLYAQYRESAELLKIEGWSYFALSGEYGRYKRHKDAFEKFTQRVEDVIRRDVRAVVSQEAREKREGNKDKGSDR